MRLGSVGENIVRRPAREVELGPHRQEAETGLGEVGAPFAFQHLVELPFQGMEMLDVGRRVFELLVGEAFGAPIGGLLLLGDIYAEQLPAQVLERLAVGEGAGQARGDLGALDRAAHDDEIVVHRRQGEAREMEELGHLLIGQPRL